MSLLACPFSISLTATLNKFFIFLKPFSYSIGKVSNNPNSASSFMLQIFFYCYKLGVETCKLQLKIEIDEIKIDDVEKCGYVINSIVTRHEFGHSDQIPS